MTKESMSQTLSCPAKQCHSQTLLILCVSSGFNIQAEADRQLRSKHPPFLLSGKECFNTGEISQFSLSALEMDQIMASNEPRN